MNLKLKNLLLLVVYMILLGFIALPFMVVPKEISWQSFQLIVAMATTSMSSALVLHVLEQKYEFAKSFDNFIFNRKEQSSNKNM